MPKRFSTGGEAPTGYGPDFVAAELGFTCGNQKDKWFIRGLP